MKFLQQMANCPWILWWGKREKKNKQKPRLSKNILYDYIIQNPLTLRTHRKLSKRHSVKLFNRR